MVVTEELTEAIESVVKSRFKDAKIVSVDVRPDVDADGEAILRVRVVFDSDLKRLDARAASGLTRHIRAKIEGIGEAAFPILSFVSQADFRNAKAETS